MAKLKAPRTASEAIAHLRSIGHPITRRKPIYMAIQRLYRGR